MRKNITSRIIVIYLLAFLFPAFSSQAQDFRAVLTGR